MARDLVSRYGMDRGLGSAALKAQRSTLPDLSAAFGQSDPTLSEDTRRRID
ncbi:hypothetical protein [Hydrogenophaga sp.]|uniref:hypothetical protein n=1 Tax=Hydrogenophaga sp. TaxID=1904254 RepID=UPI00351E6AEA